MMNKQEIRELIKIFDKSGLTKLKIKDSDFFIEMKRCGEVTVVNEQDNIHSIAMLPKTKAVDVDAVRTESLLPTFRSPMVGTFYKSPSPGSDAFVKIGSVVKKGQAIAIVEAMKIMNEIDAEFDCRIVDILVEDGQPVEFNMPLFSVEKV